MCIYIYMCVSVCVSLSLPLSLSLYVSMNVCKAALACERCEPARCKADAAKRPGAGCVLA